MSMQVGEVREVVAVEATVTNVDTFSSTVVLTTKVFSARDDFHAAAVS
jgi:hypothetical protein